MFTEEQITGIRAAINECDKSHLHNWHVIDYLFFMVKSNATWWHFPLKSTRQIINAENIY